jgi:hypothetical protein
MTLFREVRVPYNTRLGNICKITTAAQAGPAPHVDLFVGADMSELAVPTS